MERNGENPISFSSVCNMHNVIEPVLEIAFREHMIDENPATGVMKEFSGRREWEPRSLDALTAKQQAVLVDYVASSPVFREVLPILTVFLRSGMPLPKLRYGCIMRVRLKETGKRCCRWRGR